MAAIYVREKSIDEIKSKLNSMSTDLNKLSYLESAIRESGFSFEIKRFIWGELAKLYQDRKMYERAARAMSSKASVDVTVKDKVESYLIAGELYAKVGRIEDADEMFVRALRDTDLLSKEKIKLARKNIYLVCAKDLEMKGKKAPAIKYYEKLIKMKLDNFEKAEVKDKLLKTYKALGMFREAKLIEGI